MRAVAIATRCPCDALTISCRQRRRLSGRQSLQARAGLLSFFLPTKQSTNKSTQAALVKDLLRIASETNSGANASQGQRQDIKNLAEQLQEAGGVENPVYNDLTWGDYEVTYSSNPRAAGGPILRSPPGQIIFSNQQLRQTLNPPETLINSVSFKCLGLFPGNAKQPAVIQPLTGNTYKITLEPARIYGIKLGPESTERTFEVLYLDERVRVVQFLPSSPAKGSEPVLFVLRRLGAVHAPKQEHRQRNVNNMFSAWTESARSFAGSSKSKAGLATQAERRFSQQKSASR